MQDREAGVVWRLGGGGACPNARGLVPPSPPPGPPPLQTRVIIVGKNEIYDCQKLVGAIFGTQTVGSLRPPPPLLALGLVHRFRAVTASHDCRRGGQWGNWREWQRCRPGQAPPSEAPLPRPLAFILTTSVALSGRVEGVFLPPGPGRQGSRRTRDPAHIPQGSAASAHEHHRSSERMPGRPCAMPDMGHAGRAARAQVSARGVCAHAASHTCGSHIRRGGGGTTRAPQPTPHTNTRNPPRGAQVPPTPPPVPPARPSVPLHRHAHNRGGLSGRYRQSSPPPPPVPDPFPEPTLDNHPKYRKQTKGNTEGHWPSSAKPAKPYTPKLFRECPPNLPQPKSPPPN